MGCWSAERLKGRAGITPVVFYVLFTLGFTKRVVWCAMLFDSAFHIGLGGK